jgi:tetratricopeptide (TPR) repeat protein
LIQRRYRSFQPRPEFLLNLEDLYQNIRTKLLNLGYLEPQRSLVQDADQINLFRNRTFEAEIKPNSIFICDDGHFIAQHLIKMTKKCVRETISEEWHVIDRNDICFSRLPSMAISEEIIAKSEFVVGIVSNFYGEKYSNNDIGYLEHELNKAKELSRPALIFFVSENCESESNINFKELASHCKSFYDETRVLSDLMKRQENIKKDLSNSNPFFEIIEIENCEQLVDYLSIWIKKNIEKKKSLTDSQGQTLIDPPSKNNFFIPNYNHLEYDRRPVNFLIQDLDSEVINFFLDQSEAVTKLRDAALLRSGHIKKLSHLGIFHDIYPSLGALLCFAPKQLLSNQYESCKLNLVAYAGLDRGSSKPIKQQIISDNLLNLFDAAMSFLEQNLHRTGKIGTDERDELEIPRIALREAIANAIVHRNYEDSDFCKQSNRIVIYTNRIEVISYGSLPRGVLLSDLNDSPEDAITFRRNPVIAEIFRIMQRVELNASGISRIHLACRRANLPAPNIKEIHSASVKITLFRPNDQIIQTVTGNRNQVIGQVVEDVFGGQTIQINSPSFGSHFKSESKFEKYTPNNIPRSGSITFIGRAQKLQELHTQLQDNNHLAITAIAGMGGIGKTELALQYALAQKGEYPAGLCWLRARDQEIATQIVTFAKAHLGLTPPDELEIDAQVRFCWQQWPEGDALIVLDDVTNYKAIEPYLPPSDPRFKLLLTTRLQLGAAVKDFPVEELDEDSAIMLLESLVKNGRIQAQSDDSKALCNWVGYLPLALELLGRFLARKPDWSIVRLLKALEENRLETQALIVPESGMTAKLGIAAALELSWQELNEAERDLACLLGMFASAPFSWPLVEKCYPNSEFDELEETRDHGLISRSLLNRVGESRYQLHQIVQEYFRIKLEQRSDKGEGIKGNYCRVMVAIAKTIDETPTINEIDSVRGEIVHLEEVVNRWSDSLDAAELIWPYVAVGRYYAGQGNYELALPLYEEILLQCKQRLGAEHPDIATCLNNLAGLYERQGRYEEAVPLYLQALEMSRKLLGTEHPDLATSLNNLAHLYYSQGRYEEAEPLYQKALEMLRKLLGSEHPDLATSLNNLGLLYYSQGRYEEAEPLYQKALEMSRKLLGTEHPDIATSLNNLAYLYCSQARYEEAEPLYQKALDMRLKLLGREHPDVATSLNNLAELHYNQGRYQEAEPFYEQSLDMRLKQLGSEHPDVATSLNNLAKLYKSQGRYQEAESFYKQSLDMRLKLLGTEHPDVAISLWSLGTLYQKQEKIEEAKALYRRALVITKKMLGLSHPYTQGIKSWLESMP